MQSRKCIALTHMALVIGLLLHSLASDAPRPKSIATIQHRGTVTYHVVFFGAVNQSPRTLVIIEGPGVDIWELENNVVAVNKGSKISVKPDLIHKVRFDAASRNLALISSVPFDTAVPDALDKFKVYVEVCLKRLDAKPSVDKGQGSKSDKTTPQTPSQPPPPANSSGSQSSPAPLRQETKSREGGNDM